MMRARHLHLNAMRRNRRGNYAIITALMITVLMGFGALAVDVSYMRLVQAQAQNVADATTQAALMELRGSGSVAQATQVAEIIASKNSVGGQPGNLSSIDFGLWDPNTQSFTITSNGPNAVRAKIERRGEDAVDFWLAPVIGFDTFNVSAEATSASRPLHLILSIDVTGSWNQTDFGYARSAVLELSELLTNSYGNQDMVGMNVFSGPYAYEFTPLTPLADIANDPNQDVLDQWGALNVMSRAGQAQAEGVECNQHWQWTQNLIVQYNGGLYYLGGYYRNYFDWPEGGCYSTMPREYLAEPGTDQSLGLEMSALMFAKENNPSAFRAQIVLTDGYPNGNGSRDPERDGVGFMDSDDLPLQDGSLINPHFQGGMMAAHDEERYEYILRNGSVSSDSVRNRSIELAEEMWEDNRVHTYTVSFVADDWFLADMPQGQGYYTVTNSSSALIPMFQAIGRSLPMTLVQ